LAAANKVLMIQNVKNKDKGKDFEKTKKTENFGKASD
jgi:hypothetical protein